MSSPAKTDLPAIPYPGIEPFTYAEREVFFARASEARRLVRLITLYRGVLLYAASGVGKSSLINAGVIPLAIEEGYRPERLRVQPTMNEEILVEPIPSRPSILADGNARTVLSVELFMAKLRAQARETRPLLIFDQFEEWVTLFERETACQARILEALSSLINDSQLPVKILIVLREDYLANLQPLFERCPNLPDHYLRLTGLGGDAIHRTIRSPFERFPEVYKPEIEPDLASEIVQQLVDRAEGGGVPLTEVQIVCRTLFEAGLQGEDPARVFKVQKDVPGILERFLEGKLDSLGVLRDPAIALLSRMVTSAGTRNIIAGDDLLDLALEDGFPRQRLGEALDLLERKTRLVRKELRREVYFYEIVSEFLVPWIRDRAERLRVKRAKSRLRLIVAGLAAGAVVLAGIAASTSFLWRQTERQKQLRIAQLLAKESTENSEARDAPRALLFAVESVRRARRAGNEGLREAEESLRAALSLAPGHALGNYGRPVFTAAMSADGHWLAGAGKGDVLYLWRTAPEGPLGEPLQLSGYHDALETFAISPDARWLAATGETKAIALWNLTAKNDGPRLLPTDGQIEKVLFSSDGRWLVADDNDTPRAWNLGGETGRADYRLSGCTSTKWSGSSTLRWVAVGCDDGVTEVWDLKGARPARRDLRPQPDAIWALDFSPDEGRLATASLDGTVRVWRLDPSEADPLDKLPGDEREVFALAFHPDGSRLAIVSSGGGVGLWTAAGDSALPSRLRSVSQDSMSRLAWSEDGRWLVARDQEDRGRLWALSPSGELVPVWTFQRLLRAAAFSPDSRWLAAGDKNGNLLRLGLRQPLSRPDVLRAHEGPVLSLTFSGGNRLLTRSDRGPARLWDLDQPLLGDEPRILSAGKAAAISKRSAPRPVSASRITIQGDVPVLHEGRKSIPLRRHDGGVKAWDLSQDGNWLLTGDGKGKARLWSLQRVRKLVQAGEPAEPVKTATHRAAVKAVAFSPDGRWLLTVGGNAFLWHLSEPNKEVTLQPLLEHPDNVTAGAVSSDSRWLATADDRGTIRLWDLSQTLPRVVDLPGHGTRAVTRVWFDSATVLAVDDGGTLRRWRTDLDELMDLACRSAGRNLSPAEWGQSVPGEDYDGRTCPDFPATPTGASVPD